MMKTLPLIAILFFLMYLPGMTNAAGSPDCYSTFYQTKDMQCVDALLDSLRSVKVGPVAQSSPDHSNFQAAVGFLAVLFRDDPQAKNHILSKEESAFTKGIYVEALYRAGLSEDAKQYADANGLSETFALYQGRNLPLLKQVNPTAVPSDNDLLIGAYMASGDAQYIKRILANYTNADDGRVSDAFRMAMMNGKFGGSLAPKGRGNIMASAACRKYECKTNIQNFMRTMTMSAAFWALQSLAQHDDGIKKTLVDFLENDPRVKQLLAIERNGFSNYLTILVTDQAGVKDPKIENALSIYENLGSAKAAQDAVFDKRN